MVKTITITDEAYEKIKAQKRPEESFSKLFIRTSQRRVKLGDLLGILSSGNKEADAREAREWQQRIKKMREEDIPLQERRHALLRQLSTH